jgi:two-component system, OmpR family, sensor histidine kinase PrrB
VSRFRSLRARVTLAATGAVVLVVAVAGILIVTTFAQRERSRLDRQLQNRVDNPVFTMPAPPPAPPRGVPGPPELSEGTGTFTRVYRGRRLVFEAGDVPSAEIPLPPPNGQPRTVRIDGRDYRTVAQRRGPFGGRIVQVAADLSSEQSRIGELRDRVIVISLLGAVLAALLVSWLVGFALRPLRRLREAVAGVSTTSDLSRRLPQGDAPSEIDELAASVNAMLGRLEGSAAETDEALRATRQFAADVGHEIRTPLTSVRANYDALERNPDMHPEERQTILREIAAEQDELVSLLDSLQALARGDSRSALPSEDLDFADLVDGAVEAAGRRHPEATVELDAPAESVPLRGWPDGLRLLIDNLLENAVRHGGRHVRVRLTVQEANGEVRLTVEDDGPGVPVEDRDRILDRFERGQGAHGPGSGLGLALVAQQAELHGGAIEVGESEELGGARFEVRLAPRGRLMESE